MVYTKVNRVKNLGRKLGYIRRAEKTDGGRYVSMFGIKGDEPGREFMNTVRDSGRERGARAIHFMVSFAGEDISPVTAHEIGMIMCADYFRGYKSVLCTHTDKNNTHFHIVINRVNDQSGEIYRYEIRKKTGKDEYSFSDQPFREALNDVLKRFDLEISNVSYLKSNTYRSFLLKEQGFMTDRERFEVVLDETLKLSFNLRDFFQLMEREGYHKLEREGKIMFSQKGARPFRAVYNGKWLTEKDIKDIIDDLLVNYKGDGPIRKRVRFRQWYYDVGEMLTDFMDMIRKTGRGEAYSDDPEVTSRLIKMRQYERYLDIIKRNDITDFSDIDIFIADLKEEISELVPCHEELSKINRKNKYLLGRIRISEENRHLNELYKRGLSEAEYGHGLYEKAEKSLVRAGLTGEKRKEFLEKAMSVKKELYDINDRMDAKRHLIYRLGPMKRELTRIREIMGLDERLIGERRVAREKNTQDLER